MKKCLICESENTMKHPLVYNGYFCDDCGFIWSDTDEIAEKEESYSLENQYKVFLEKFTKVGANNPELSAIVHLCTLIYGDCNAENLQILKDKLHKYN